MNKIIAWLDKKASRMDALAAQFRAARDMEYPGSYGYELNSKYAQLAQRYGDIYRELSKIKLPF